MPNVLFNPTDNALIRHEPPTIAWEVNVFDTNDVAVVTYYTDGKGKPLPMNYHELPDDVECELWKASYDVLHEDLWERLWPACEMTSFDDFIDMFQDEVRTSPTFGRTMVLDDGFIVLVSDSDLRKFANRLALEVMQ